MHVNPSSKVFPTLHSPKDFSNGALHDVIIDQVQGLGKVGNFMFRLEDFSDSLTPVSSN